MQQYSSQRPTTSKEIHPLQDFSPDVQVEETMKLNQFILFLDTLFTYLFVPCFFLIMFQLWT